MVRTQKGIDDPYSIGDVDFMVLFSIRERCLCNCWIWAMWSFPSETQGSFLIPCFMWLEETLSSLRRSRAIFVQVLVYLCEAFHSHASTLLCLVWAWKQRKTRKKDISKGEHIIMFSRLGNFTTRVALFYWLPTQAGQFNVCESSQNCWICRTSLMWKKRQSWDWGCCLSSSHGFSSLNSDNLFEELCFLAQYVLLYPSCQWPWMWFSDCGLIWYKEVSEVQLGRQLGWYAA